MVSACERPGRNKDKTNKMLMKPVKTIRLFLFIILSFFITLSFSFGFGTCRSAAGFFFKNATNEGCVHDDMQGLD